MRNEGRWMTKEKRGEL